MNLRRRRAPMDLLRPTSAGKRRREEENWSARDKIRGFPAAVNKENARLLRRGESEGLRFAESPAKSGLGRRKSAQGRPFRASRHAQARLNKIVPRFYSTRRHLNPSDISGVLEMV